MAIEKQRKGKTRKKRTAATRERKKNRLSKYLLHIVTFHDKLASSVLVVFADDARSSRKRRRARARKKSLKTSSSGAARIVRLVTSFRLHLLQLALRLGSFLI